ncbi:MAG: ATP-binding protein [Endomicrobium sp.]|jgi:predicted AAA+ superfamily ATPase|uniref:ATP-binding protein n=1 Tax=Candidatus Endomicrobiellum cubanum TaxID=3242325 RepID=UPI00283467D2|nr:ATP-binding protein [Endomicrobium sp.]
MDKKRTLTNAILEISKSFKVLLVTGARQVGKTTLLKNTSTPERKYVTLDNPSFLIQAKTDPQGFLEEYSPPVCIDEIQYAPELFSYIKMIVDSSNKYGRIWLTGSQSFNMMQGVTESLAGRVAILNMFGFSLYELQDKPSLQKPFLPKKDRERILDYKNSKETFKIIWQGSFPEVINKNERDRIIFYDSYIQTYIERDVRQIINISNEISFLTFLKVLAARTGQELNLTDISKSVGIAVNTAKNWLSVLQTSGLVYLLQPYFQNTTKRLTKTAKMYFMDTGLAAYLAGWTTPEALEIGIAAGSFFETFVVSEIIKSYKHNAVSADLYYYRDSDKNEIDLLIYKDGYFYPIEIKKTSTPTLDDTKVFKTFSKIEHVKHGNLICLTPTQQPLFTNATAISIWDI